MKIKSNYFILCEKAIKNERGLVSLINIFENINVEGIPTVHRDFTLAFNLSLKSVKKEKEVIIDIKIFDPEKSIIQKGKLPSKISGDSNIGIIVNVPDLLLSKFGEYKVVISHEEKEIDKLLFSVKKNE
ncbi:MAG: hypothetical protein OEX81_05195 [Candidatus Pacebacteria bacterium]|nr:hypothetical protein [Candidatus Paceibacterota bacterium]